VRQRRDALIGFATAAFRIEDLVRAATDSLSDEIEVQLLEGDRPVAGGPLAREDAATAPLRIANRRWLLVVRDPNHPALTLPALMGFLGISLAALMGALVLVWSRNERMQELQHQASEDPLTGLKNRRRFEEDLRIELARGRRDGSTGALLLLDIDDFKRVNDSSGHPAGDRALQEVASTLRRRTRETDVLARVGGDEFAVVLPHCSTDEAGAVAEAIADAIREQRPPEDGTHPLTVSIGLAMFGADSRTDFESVQSFADTGMYAAKGAGGDQVKVVTSEAEAGAAEHHAGSGEPA
jgi:diguanylate cyclase (GGDEF)-like protein